MYINSETIQCYTFSRSLKRTDNTVTPGKMTWLPILFTCGFLHLCGAGKINCNVSQSAEVTSYSIPDVDASGCDYSWAKETNTGTKPVLATGTGYKDEVVLNESISNLVTLKCIPKILYERTCSSENLEEFRSVCEIDCHEIEKMIKDPDYSWIVAGVFSMILVAGGLFYKFRNCLKKKDNLI